jgi:hypothetical protein
MFASAASFCHRLDCVLVIPRSESWVTGRDPILPLPPARRAIVRSRQDMQRADSAARLKADSRPTPGAPILFKALSRLDGALGERQLSPAADKRPQKLLPAMCHNRS